MGEWRSIFIALVTISVLFGTTISLPTTESTSRFGAWYGPPSEKAQQRSPPPLEISSPQALSVRDLRILNQTHGLRASPELRDTPRSVVRVRNGTEVGAPPGYGLSNVTNLQPHGPIYIGANANFTSSNGVRKGTGTSADPYVLSGWSFDGNQYPTAHAMIRIEQTDRYLVIENVKITNLSGTEQYVGVEIGEYPNIVRTQHVTIRHITVDSQHAYGIAVREGSSDIRVEGNDIRLEADTDWVYGAVAMRGTHNVTFYGNYVNAYTNGSYHTVGIHLSDFFVSEARDATRLVAERNTVVNATAGGIISESSWGTIIRRNLVFMNYPGLKSVAEDYPRGIQTEKGSNKTVVAENLIHTFHWGIQVGSQGGSIYSNIIHDVDYAVYVLDNNSWNGTISSYDETIYNTTYWNVSNSAFRLPLNFTGNVADLGPGIRSTDFTPVLLVTHGTPSRVAYDWSGFQLNLSVTLGTEVLFDTVDTMESQTLHGAWSGPVDELNVMSFLPSNMWFQLKSGTDILFDGSGFLARTPYDVSRSNGTGTTRVLDASTTPTGILRFTIPGSIPSTYFLRPDTAPPGTVYNPHGIGGANGWYVSAVNVTLSAMDYLSGVQAIHFRIDGSAWNAYSVPVTVATDGSHIFEYYATDNAGNSEVAHWQSLRLDGTPPLLGNLTPSGRVTSSTVTISWTGSDETSGIAGYEVGVDGGQAELVGMHTAVTVSLRDGDHIVAIIATDAAGNRAESQTRIRMDTNVFALSGPYSGIPSIAIIVLAVFTTGFVLWRRTKRRMRARPLRNNGTVS